MEKGFAGSGSVKSSGGREYGWTGEDVLGCRSEREEGLDWTETEENG